MSHKLDNSGGSFWMTMPGCLAGIAAILTAIGGLITVLFTVGIFKSSSTPVPPTEQVSTLVDLGVTRNQPQSQTSTLTATLPSLPYEEISDTTTVEQGMHVCPKGFALGGANWEQNEFLCRRVMQSGEEQYVESIVDIGTAPTVRSEMHTCPTGLYIRGVHLGNNDLLCSYDARKGRREWQEEFTDSSTYINGIRVCSNDTQRIQFLTGINYNDDKFLCGTYTGVYAP